MKTFFVDIDGVIYKNGEINKKLISLIEQENNKLIFCTGRGYMRSLDIVKEYLNNNSILIIENGSKIVDLYGNKIFFKNISDKEKEVIKNIDYNQLEYILFNPNDSKYYISYSKKKLNHVQTNCSSYDMFCKEMYNKDITQITIKFNSNEYKGKFLLLCKNKNINIKLSEDYVVINAHNVSKQSAIIQCLEKMHIDNSDVIIIGNDCNDLEMFDVSCMSKIAVVDEYTPKLLIKKATVATDFNHLVETVKKIVK